MRNALVAFLVVFGLVAATAPASAQYYGYDPYWGGIARIQQDMVGTPNAMLARNLCANHQGTGDLVEQSWCYGRKYDLDGSFAGYNPQSVALGQYYGQSYGYNGYGYGRGHHNGRIWGDVAKVAGGAVVGVLIGRATAPKPKPEPRQQVEEAPEPEPAPAPPQGPEDIELVINQTGCRAKVNGTELAPGQTVRVHTPTSKVSVLSTTCTPVYKNLQPGVVALVCAK